MSLENDLTVRSKTTEIDVKDFVAGSYATILGQEVSVIVLSINFNKQFCLIPWNGGKELFSGLIPLFYSDFPTNTTDPILFIITLEWCL